MKSPSSWSAVLCVAPMLLALGSPVTAQDKPDFSGTWMLASPSSAADIAQTLTVSQTVVRNNVRGEPIEPFIRDITVTRTLAGGPQTETYRIGVSGGVVSGIGRDGTRFGSSRHLTVQWDGDALTLEEGTYTGSAPETGTWSEHREVWTLDSHDQLRVRITARGSNQMPVTTALLYRRQ